MPHHPGAGCEVEKAVAGADVALDVVFFFVLEEGPDGAVNDAFGFAGRAAGVEDVDWVVGGEGREV